jgi:RNA-directed DNA polymerase
VLLHAWGLAKANAGAPGVGGESFGDIESRGVMKWWEGLGKELHGKTYQPQPVRRAMMPKPGGESDRWGSRQSGTGWRELPQKLILEPILEADLEPNAYGYRPKKSAQDAIQEVDKLLYAGYTDIVDADLSKYIDTIPHSELMRWVARRVVSTRAHPRLYLQPACLHLCARQFLPARDAPEGIACCTISC